MATKGKDVASQLMKQPLQVRLAVLGGVLVVLGGLYWQFFYSTLSDAKKQAAITRKKLATEEENIREKEAEYQQLLKEKKALDDQLRQNQLTLPASSELPAFFVHLQKQAAAAGVNIQKWSRLKEQAVETYVKVPVSMTIQGTFYQINNYFRLLGQTDRIITIESLSVGSANDDSGEVLLTARYTAATFRQKDRPPDETIPEEPPQKTKKADASKGGSSDKANNSGSSDKPNKGGSSDKPNKGGKAAGGAGGAQGGQQ